ncbi:hypothetical protein [Endozoicomonas sp. ALC020]|uniref:hypothetical protein n=1 Tax=unclassified Endozoicomonas TaxID=2644528 RepID=UPI003BB22036
MSYIISNISERNCFKTPDLPCDDKRQKFFSYEIKTTLIESISRQLLYATNLLVAFELIMTSKAPPLSATSYSWLPIEGVVTVGWLLKSYWNPDSPLFQPFEQSEMRLTQGNQPFAITIMMHGSGYNQQQPHQQSQLPESSGQQAPQANSRPTSAFTNPLSSGSGDGFEDPQQHAHTLGIDCFVHPCHGVCNFRPSSESIGSTERVLNTTAPVPVPCNLTILDEDGQLRNCEKVYKSAFSLLNHKRAYHSGKKTCLALVVGKDGQLRPCGKVCKNASTLGYHKRKTHTGQQTCDVIVVEEDGQERPCRKVCKNADALSNHKKNAHSGQRTCDVTVVDENGQLRPCGKVLKNAGLLSSHKRDAHTEQETCDVIVVGEGHQQRPCGRVCKNAKALSSHKTGCHSGQKTCAVLVISKDGKPQLCGRVFKNAYILSDHKQRKHSGQKTCDVTLVGKDGQPRPCGKVFKNAKTLSVHKRMHRKRKPVDTNQKDSLSPP